MAPRRTNICARSWSLGAQEIADRLAGRDSIRVRLPKTRSGKIMRRILRKIAEGEFSTLGDTSTLADPSVVSDLVKNRPAS